VLLYKYLPPGRTDVVTNRRIRFTPPGAFNDPFEFRPVLGAIASDEAIQNHVDREFDKAVDEKLRELGPLVRLLPPHYVETLRAHARSQMLPTFRLVEAELIPKLRSEFDAKFNEHFGVLCLSECWDSLLMWGHYSQSHEGFVLGFDSDHAFFNQRRSDQDEFGHLRRVRYQEKRPVVSLRDSGGLEWFETKASVWSYENEWRMFLLLSAATEVIASSIHLFDFPLDCVKEILFGARCSEDTESVLRKAFVGCRHPPQFIRCAADDSDYRVIRKNVVG
jgi:hypothetical protein